MLTLALENSSPQASLALLRGDVLLAERVYRPSSRESGRIFELFEQLLSETNTVCADIECYVTGRGPGNYSGMRVVLTMAQALALPGKREVLAVSSGAALAKETMERERRDVVAVVGDARRQRFWMGVFERRDEALVMDCDWRLYSADELREALPPGGVVVSSEMDRLPTDDWSGVCRIDENRYPSACVLAELASIRIAGGEAMEPLRPLYMHPPV